MSRRSRPSAAGSTWIEGMQSSDGGWAAFDVDNVQTLCRELPFCDFGELIDPPSADVTAHVLEALAGREQHGEARSSAASRGCFAPRRTTDPGSGAGAPTTSTALAPRFPASSPAGVPTDHPAIRRAVTWLERASE